MKRLPPSGTRARSGIRTLLRDTRGATIVEYAILLFLILCVGAAASRILGKTARSGVDHATGSF